MHFLPWQGSKIVGHCSCWRTLCFEEGLVQLLSHIAEAWVLSFFTISFLENFSRFLIIVKKLNQKPTKIIPKANFCKI